MLGRRRKEAEEEKKQKKERSGRRKEAEEGKKQKKERSRRRKEANKFASLLRCSAAPLLRSTRSDVKDYLKVIFVFVK